MAIGRNHIIAQLKKEILLLEGHRPAPAADVEALKKHPFQQAFPQGTLPLGGIHEFVCGRVEERAASAGFMTALLSPLLSQGILVWISSGRTLFPPALSFFGIDPDRVLFVDVREKELLWATEEALKCAALQAVVSEVSDAGFIASRRLQLAAEQSQVTGFILRRQSAQLNSSACLARWKVSPLHTDAEEELPGLHHPRWDVQLLKIRNGKPGRWSLQWSAAGLQTLHQPFISLHQARVKTG